MLIHCALSGSAKVSQVKASSNAPKALIIEPSKELAEQTYNNVKLLKKYVDSPKLRYEQVEMISTWVVIIAEFHKDSKQ